MLSIRNRNLGARVTALFVGLTMYGFSMSLMIGAGLGLDPWDVFHQGLSQHVPLTFGAITAVTGVFVLLAWIPLRQRPGVGTVSNVIVIAVSVDAGLALLPPIHGTPLRVAALASGVLLNALATVLYIGAGLGPGPRDGLMTGLVARTGLSVRLVRTAIELTVVVTGWLLGGNVGVGTVVYAFGIGPLVQLFMRYMPALRRTKTVCPANSSVDPASTGVVSSGVPSAFDESKMGT